MSHRAKNNKKKNAVYLIIITDLGAQTCGCLAHVVIVHEQVMAKVHVVVSDIQNSLRRLAEISVNTLTCVRDQVENVTGSGLGEGEQLYSPFHRLDFYVLFDAETSFEFHHGFIHTQLTTGGVYFSETFAEIVQYLLDLPRADRLVDRSILVVDEVKKS